MEKNNRLLKFIFYFLVILVFWLAFLRVSNTGIGGVRPIENTNRSGNGLRTQMDLRTLEALKQEEFLGVAPSKEYAAVGNQQQRQGSPRYTRGSAGGVTASMGGQSYGQGYASQAQVAGRYAPSPLSAHLPSSGRSYGREGAGLLGDSSSAAYHGSRERGNFYSSASHTSTAAKRGGSSAGLGGVARPTTEQRMQGIFSPYLTSLTKEQSVALEKQLTGLSSRVERAVLQALMPKSRKDANIEKYLQRNSAHSANSGPFGSVMDQMAAQKAGIMNSMNGAFGKEAADEAGKLMDAYQQELAAALSQPGQTQEQLAQKARAIGQKYEKELQELGQQHALKEFEDKQLQKDDILQNRLAGAYGAEIAAQAGQMLADAREKDLQLAMAGLPQDEYYARYLENQRARRKELEQLLLKNGKSLQGLQAAEDELERLRVEQALKDEEEGKTLPKEHHFDDKTIATAANDLQRERNEKLELAARIYGDVGSAEVNAIYDRHEALMGEIMQSDLPLTVKQQRMMEVRQQTNAEISALQKTPKMQAAREQGQVNSTMAQLMQDPGVANASPEEKAAFEAYARPVLQDMFHRINTISDSNLPEDVKQQQIAAVQDRAQRQLSGQ